MKKYRALVPIILIFFMGISWYTLITDSAEEDTSFNNYLAEARKWVEDGVPKYAIQNYNKALEIRDNVDIYVEVAKYYKSEEDIRGYENWSKTFLSKYPAEPRAYDCILDAYLIQKDYESCFDIISVAEKREISTDFIKETVSKIEYEYKLDFNNYENVGVYSSGFCSVQNKGAWGFVDLYGKQRIGCNYIQVGIFGNENKVSVVNSEGETFFIDEVGDKVSVSKKEYQSLGIFVNDFIVAVKQDGKYTYIDSELKPLFGEYDYASNINYGVAAVKNNEQWQLINSEGSLISDSKYGDVKIDEKQIAFRNGRAFVLNETGKYIMVDSEANKVGNLEYDDAKVFSSESPAAVKIDGKWCFVDSQGELISDKKYDDARSFINGLAAICKDGKWGFVDENENIVIEPQFFDAKDFTEKGSCFVKTGDKWQLLRLYRLNREE